MKKKAIRDDILTDRMSPSQESYDPHYFEPLFAAEERHFWFTARNKVISSLVRKSLTDRTEVHLLEVGCGTGNVLRALEKEFPDFHLVGMDLFQEGLKFARRRVNCALVQADLAYPPFGRLFDLIGLFDVLEHIKEDNLVLKHIFEMVRPDGWMLLTVPANPSLWSYFDVASHHVRRYTVEDLREKVQSAGFEVQFASPYMSATYPLVWFNRHSKNKAAINDESKVQSQAEDELKNIPVVNDILRGILSLEAGWLSRGNLLPFGSSLVLLAHKATI
ncbi:MAG TPA: class I SAM-dependent methyltransferase [Leptolinea sp.]